MNQKSFIRRAPQQRRLQTAWSLVALTAAISLFGVLTLLSASRSEHQPVSFANDMLHVFLGVAALAALSLCGCAKLKRFSIPLYAAGVLLPG